VSQTSGVQGQRGDAGVGRCRGQVAAATGTGGVGFASLSNVRGQAPDPGQIRWLFSAAGGQYICEAAQLSEQAKPF
jgi:hypothetical protein